MALTAKQVVVFPSTKTQSINKLITENSLTRLINRLINKESYVITHDEEWESLDLNQDILVGSSNGFNPEKPFEMCLGGYYIGVDSLNSIISDANWNPTSEGETLYAFIQIDKTSANYPELIGQYSIAPHSEESFNFASGEYFQTGVTKLPPTTKDFSPSQVQDLVLLNKEGTASPTIISKPGAVSLSSDWTLTCSQLVGYESGYDYRDVTHARYSVLTDFTGLSFGTTEPTGDDYISLPILKYFAPVNRDLATYIPFDSLNRFKTESIYEIDGGEIPANN